MAKVSLVALKRHKYGGEVRRVGHRYDAKRADAKALVFLKLARSADVVSPPMAPPMATSRPVFVDLSTPPSSHIFDRDSSERMPSPDQAPIKRRKSQKDE